MIHSRDQQTSLMRNNSLGNRHWLLKLRETMGFLLTTFINLQNGGVRRKLIVVHLRIVRSKTARREKYRTDHPIVRVRISTEFDNSSGLSRREFLRWTHQPSKKSNCNLEFIRAFTHIAIFFGVRNLEENSIVTKNNKIGLRKWDKPIRGKCRNRSVTEYSGIPVFFSSTFNSCSKIQMPFIRTSRCWEMALSLPYQSPLALFRAVVGSLHLSAGTPTGGVIRIYFVRRNR